MNGWKWTDEWSSEKINTWIWMNGRKKELINEWMRKKMIDR